MQVVSCLLDPMLKRRVELLGVAQDLQCLGRADGELVDAREQLEELPFAARQLLDQDGGSFVGCAGWAPLSRRACRESRTVFKPPAFEPVGAKKTIDEYAEKRDEEYGPEPREGGGGPLFQK